MIGKIISLMLIFALLHGGIAAQDQYAPQRQSTAKMQKVLRKAEQKNKAVVVTLNDGSKVTGRIGNISDTDFALTEQKTGTTTRYAYPDVRDVRQKGLSTAAEIAIGIGIAVGALVALFYAVYPKT